MIITIDGPSASGKSSAAKMLAKDLGFFYLSSGMLFRAVAYILKKYFGFTREQFNKITEEDVAKVLDEKAFEYNYSIEQDTLTIAFKGDNITPFLKLEIIDDYSSIIGKNLVVRAALLDFQYNLAKKYDLVVEGRDMGSVVFPNAEKKFFLTASLDERAKRWQGLQAKKGKQYTVEQTKKIISERDHRDETRKVAPLCIPEGAIIIDNSGLTQKQTIEKFKKYL